MKNFSENIPLILLVGLVPYFFYSQPNISQSIISAALCGLVGYRYYLESLKKPDYVQLFKKAFSEQEQKHEEVYMKLKHEIDETKAAQGKINITNNTQERIKAMKW
jgi:hypothetical protein